MSLLSSFKQKIYNVFYAIPFAMRGGNVLTKNGKEENTSLVQTIQKDRLSDALLKGVVTQQVEELRYRDYKVSEESRKYKYLGNGIAVKVETPNTTDTIKFTQNNHILCKGVLDELERVDKEKYGVDSYTLNILYHDVPRFKLEKYCLRFSFSSTKGNTSLMMYFDTLPDVYDKTSKSFINELEKVNNGYSASELLNNIKQIIFVTTKVNGEKDFVRYTLRELKAESWGKSDNEYYIKFSIGLFEREDLIEKFKSDEMEEKYAKVAPKETDTTKTVTLDLKKYKCSECGTLISDVDAMLSYEVLGKRMCAKCWGKNLQK